MKRFAWLLLFAVSAAAVAADASVDGKWDVSTSIAGYDGSMVCSFTQKDPAISGSCTGDDGDHPLTGTVDGNKVTWQYKSEYNGQPLTITFTATVAAPDQFAGNVDVEPMGVGGDFTAKRKNQ